LLISLWTRIHCRNREVRYDIRSSLKELRRAVMDERKLLNVSRIIPGDWGKAESGWLAWPLLRMRRKMQRAEAGFTSSSGSVRALSVTRKGTWRRGMIRNRSESNQVAQAGFELE
jgi:hypothetical protein